MGTGTLALALLLGGMVSSNDGPIPLKDRAVSIPYNLTVNPAEVSEVLLFVSIDQGKVWSRAGVIKPTEKSFAFQAPTDGIYWFNVAVVYRNGSQVPADVSTTPPQQKVMFDSQKPIVRTLNVERVNGEVQVSWDIQEPNPDLGSLKLEYHPINENGTYWYAVPASPGMAGSAKFMASGTGPITVRLSMADTAGNIGTAEKNLAPAVAGVNPVQQATALNGQPSGVMPLPAAAMVPPPVEPQYPTAPQADPVPQPAAPTPVPLATSTSRSTSPAPQVPFPNAATTHTTFRPDQPEIHHTNEPQVTIDYEIERQGPSGVSKIEVYLTQDDGKNWMKWQDLNRNDGSKGEAGPATKLPVTVRLPDREGSYGYRLVPYSGTQLSTGAPVSGTEPEFRILYDKTAPYVELFKPEADPNQINALVLSWRATDPNLSATPIHIYWSERADGDWKPVNALDPQAHDAAGLPNTGKYTWVLPAGMPYKVHLKIVAEDKAGNLGEAVTSQPVGVDVHKPVGRFRGIVDTKRKN